MTDSLALIDSEWGRFGPEDLKRQRAIFLPTLCRPRQPCGLHLCGTTMNADAQQAEAEAAEWES